MVGVYSFHLLHVLEWFPGREGNKCSQMEIHLALEPFENLLEFKLVPANSRP